MKSFLGIAIILVMAPTAASAQDKDTPFRVDGYLFIGEGYYTQGYWGTGFEPSYMHDSIRHAGVGGDVQLAGGFGVGGELAVMGRSGQGAGIFSINPFYRFRHTSTKTKLVPFIVGGYTGSLDTRDYFTDSSLFNFGGGADYWVLKKVGLRLEFRDYVERRVGAPISCSPQFPAFRIGVVLR